jgi:hypothetical protein
LDVADHEVEPPDYLDLNGRRAYEIQVADAVAAVMSGPVAATLQDDGVSILRETTTWAPDDAVFVLTTVGIEHVRVSGTARPFQRVPRGDLSAAVGHVWSVFAPTLR